MTELALPNPIVRNSLAVSSDLSIAPALEISAQLVPFHTAVKELEDQGTRVKIDSPEAFQRGTEFLSICKQHATQLESFRVTVKRPIDDYGKFIQALFKPLLERLDGLSRSVGAHMLAFQKAERERLEREQAEARKRQEEEALKLAQEREASGDTEAAAAIMEAATMAPMPMAAPRLGVTNSAGQRAQVTARWVGTVAEPMEVLKAILAGKYPVSLIDWKPIELNRAAAAIKAEGVHLGLRVSKEESLGMRR